MGLRSSGVEETQTSPVRLKAQRFQRAGTVPKRLGVRAADKDRDGGRTGVLENRGVRTRRRPAFGFHLVLLLFVSC